MIKNINIRKKNIGELCEIFFELKENVVDLSNGKTFDYYSGSFFVKPTATEKEIESNIKKFIMSQRESKNNEVTNEILYMEI